MGRESEGDLSLQLLPTECFLSPESMEQGRPPQIGNTWETGCRARAGRGRLCKCGEAFGQQGGSLKGSCLWLPAPHHVAGSPRVTEASGPISWRTNSNSSGGGGGRGGPWLQSQGLWGGSSV